MAGQPTGTLTPPVQEYPAGQGEQMLAVILLPAGHATHDGLTKVEPAMHTLQSGLLVAPFTQSGKSHAAAETEPAGEILGEGHGVLLVEPSKQ